MNGAVFWLLLLGIYLFVIFYFSFRKMPSGVDYSGPERKVHPHQIKFLYDLTWTEEGQRRADQNIFDNILSMVANAEKFIVVDMFLFNTNKTQGGGFLPITRRFVDHLVRIKQQKPNVHIFFITDPINNFYGSYASGPLQVLEENGINVIVSDVNQLRDRNYFYAGVWRILFQWFGTRGKGWLPDPLRSRRGRVTLRSMLKAMNARANHRKLVLCDSGKTYVSLVTSANIHEASSWLSNIGFAVEDAGIALDCLKIEQTVARLSDADIPIDIPDDGEAGPVRLRLLSEKRIAEYLLKDIDATASGDKIQIAMLFLGDPTIVNALVQASRRGVEVLLVLDTNLSSFGITKKMALPNQFTVQQILKRSRSKIRVMWWRNQKDEFHSKLVMIQKGPEATLYGGSANLTRRNIGGYTLEAMLRIQAEASLPVVRDVQAYFDRITGGAYSSIAEVSAKGSIKRALIYHLQQFSGVTTY